MSDTSNVREFPYFHAMFFLVQEFCVRQEWRKNCCKTIYYNSQICANIKVYGENLWFATTVVGRRIPQYFLLFTHSTDCIAPDSDRIPDTRYRIPDRAGDHIFFSRSINFWGVHLWENFKLDCNSIPYSKSSSRCQMALDITNFLKNDAFLIHHWSDPTQGVDLRNELRWRQFNWSIWVKWRNCKAILVEVNTAISRKLHNELHESPHEEAVVEETAHQPEEEGSRLPLRRGTHCNHVHRKTLLSLLWPTWNYRFNYYRNPSISRGAEKLSSVCIPPDHHPSLLSMVSSASLNLDGCGQPRTICMEMNWIPSRQYRRGWLHSSHLWESSSFHPGRNTPQPIYWPHCGGRIPTILFSRPQRSVNWER